jgi:hypothetical protein
MSARLRRAVLGLGVAILTGGCRGRSDSARQGASSTVHAEVAIPFTPVPGESSPPHPCGPKRRGPCLLLGWEYYDFAAGYSHSAWFMDTDGREYQYGFGLDARPLVPDPQADPVRSALIDGSVSDDDFARIVAVSTALPRRVIAAEVTHALSLLTSSQAGKLEALRDSVCYDSGGGSITGYLFPPDGKEALPNVLEEEQCFFIMKANRSPAARELAQWVHKLRAQ